MPSSPRRCLISFNAVISGVPPGASSSFRRDVLMLTVATCRLPNRGGTGRTHQNGFHKPETAATPGLRQLSVKKESANDPCGGREPTHLIDKTWCRSQTQRSRASSQWRSAFHSSLRKRSFSLARLAKPEVPRSKPLKASCVPAMVRRTFNANLFRCKLLILE